METTLGNQPPAVGNTPELVENEKKISHAKTYNIINENIS